MCASPSRLCPQTLLLPRLDLASFTTTFMEPEAEEVIACAHTLQLPCRQQLAAGPRAH